MQPFAFDFSLEKFDLILDENADYQKWYDVLCKVLPEYEIITINRVASFLSQTIYESDYYNDLEENLNYNADRLMEIFPKYFKNKTDALLYERRPQEIANKVYANRLGNGNEESGDGWKYRGRGLIQTTGKDNYIYISDAFTNVDIVKNPDLLTYDMAVAVHSAGLYWYDHNINSLADTDSIKSITKIINGGFKGLDERQDLYDNIYNILN